MGKVHTNIEERAPGKTTAKAWLPSDGMIGQMMERDVWSINVFTKSRIGRGAAESATLPPSSEFQNASWAIWFWSEGTLLKLNQRLRSQGWITPWLYVELISAAVQGSSSYLIGSCHQNDAEMLYFTTMKIGFTDLLKKRGKCSCWYCSCSHWHLEHRRDMTECSCHTAHQSLNGTEHNSACHK